MGSQMSVKSAKLASRLTKYVRSQGEVFYGKDNDAKVDAFALGYIESFIARMMDENPSVRDAVTERLQLEAK